MRYLLTTLLLAFPLSVFAIDEACLLSKYEQYAVAQENWQKDLTHLAISHNPELTEVANLYLNDQLVLIEKRLIAVSTLLSHSPLKLHTQKKINRWLKLDTSDESELAKLSPSYVSVLKKHQANKSRQPHKSGDKLREVMRTQVSPSKGFKVLYTTFTDKVSAINNIVCSDT